MQHELIQKETLRWLRYAREDLNAAIILQKTDIPRHVCLLAQQSAEKALKSIFAFTDQRIVKSHDLDMLLSLIPEGWNTKSNFSDLSELSIWAVESRYPGDMPDATEEDADSAIALAEAILHSVEDDLRKHGFTE